MTFAIRVVQPSNFLSVAAATLFHTEIRNVVDAGADIIVIDLTNITSMSSSSLMALVKTLKFVRASKCQLCLCSMNEQIRMLFELTGLDQVFKTYADFDEVMVHMQPTDEVEMRRQSKHEADVLTATPLQLAS